MAIFKSFSYFATFGFFVLCFNASENLAANASSSFSLRSFGKDSIFAETLALYGDAKVVNGGSSIQLTDSVGSSSGRVVYKKPIRLFVGKEENFVSLSTYFSFSMSNETGNGLDFVMVPVRSVENGTAIGVRLDASKNDKFGDFSKNHLTIDLGSQISAKIGNLSSVTNMVLNDGENLHCWIDYEASSKRFEVRLSKSGRGKPDYPMISYSIDLMGIYRDEKLFVGLSSSNGSSCFVYSWSFKLRRFPHWRHSQPLDPKRANNKTSEGRLVIRNRSGCVWKMIGALILGAVCGTLGAFSVLYFCTVCGGRRPMAVVPEESGGEPADKEEKKMEVVVVGKPEEAEGKN